MEERSGDVCTAGSGAAGSMTPKAAGLEILPAPDPSAATTGVAPADAPESAEAFAVPSPEEGDASAAVQSASTSSAPRAADDRRAH